MLHFLPTVRSLYSLIHAEIPFCLCNRGSFRAGVRPNTLLSIEVLRRLRLVPSLRQTDSQNAPYRS